MSRRALPPTLAAILVLLFALSAGPALAIEFTVSASSQFMPLFGSFGPENLLDGDPATAWAEGVPGAGEGEWVLFEFGRELTVERIGVRNGWQSEGEFEANNRPASLRLTFSDGSERTLRLDPGPQWQMFDVNARTSAVRLVIDSVLPGSNVLKYNRTCISDVSFELALPPGAQALSGAAPRAAGQEADAAAPEEESAPKPAASGSHVEPADQASDQAAAQPADPAAGPDVSDQGKKIGLADIFGGEPEPVLPAVDVEAMSAAPSAAPGPDSGAASSAGQDTGAAASAAAASGDAASIEQTEAARPTEKHRFSLGDLFGSLDGPELAPVDVEAMSGKASASASAPASGATIAERTRAAAEAAKAATAEGAIKGAQEDDAGKRAASADEEAGAAAPGNLAGGSVTHRDELPEVEVDVMAGERAGQGGEVAAPKDQEAVRGIIRAYFTKLVTLDDGYVELYAKSVREDEGFMFEYFKELQRQRHVYHLFRKALVDTSGLRFGPALLEHKDRLKLEVDGRCTLYVADTYEDMPVHTRFTFVREDGAWRIREAEDLEPAEAD